MPKHGPHTSDHQLPPTHHSSRLRNLWAAPGGGVSQWGGAGPGGVAPTAGCDSSGNLSSSSAASSRTYYQPATSSVYQEPLALAPPGGDTGNYALPRDALLPPSLSHHHPPHPYVTQPPYLYPVQRPAPPPQHRPITPASCATSTDGGGGVNACGGHCVPLENFCHYCLQVMNIAGILTGISLVIAGSILRGQKRGGDLMVLVYIGVLIAMVCTLLLSVQCCVRRNVKRRQRMRRGGGGGGGVMARGARGEAIQLQLLGPPPPPSQVSSDPMLRSLMPHRTVEVIRPARDQSGIPWWRREEVP